jgi:hypothetical protein
VNLLRSLRPLLTATIAGALLGAACVVVAYAWRPTLTVEMDRALPRKISSGFYDGERSGDTTFAWTSQRADVKLPGLSRRTAWTCTVRLRAGRSDPATFPSVDLAADGVTTTTVKATNEFQEASIVLPPRAASGGIVSITSSSTLVPGPSDPRQLGVQIDRIVCAPSGGYFHVPPPATIRDAALTAGIFGAAFALSSVTLATAIVGVLVLAIAQALPLSAGPAPYTGFSDTMVWFGFWIASLSVVLLTVMARWRGMAFHNSARLVILLSGAILYLKLLGLLHPSKLLVDAVFHAHRFEWVLAGRYFFTQGMPGGVSFPYAIGLYVFAAPWSFFFHDHVSLLRVVVCAAQVIAGALLYPLVVRAWNDRVAGVLAVVLFSVVPLPYGLVGNANLTNTFGEAVALAAVLSASLLPVTVPLVPAACVFLLVTLAFLSHVSTFALLVTTLTALVILYRWRGERELHRTAWLVFAITIAGALVAVVLYYGHFGDVYRTALRVRANNAVTQAQPETPDVPVAAPTQPRSLGSRIADALTFAAGTIGWPVLILALAGVIQLSIDRARDRATLAIGAWTVAGAAFLGVAVMRVDAPFQRYAAEFFGRVLLATYPAAVLLAARGAAWGWRVGQPTRIGSFVLVCGAIALGVQAWLGWFL